MSSNDAVRRYARRAGSAARGLRQRVADESRLNAKVARLEAKLGELTKQLVELRTTVDGLQPVPAPVATGPARTGRPAPVQVGVVDAPLSPELETVITAVREEHLTYLSIASLRTLATAVSELEAAGIPGLILEAGTARGGSAIVMATAKSNTRAMKVYDVFAMIPPPGSNDGADVHRRYETIVSGAAQGVGGQTYYGYRDDLLSEVTESFTRHGVPAAEHNVELVRGLFEDTITLDEPVALAHLDGDWYESTMTCLTRIAPLLPTGGRLVIDDYDAWSGCRTAIEEYFAARSEFRFERRGKLHIVRL